MTLHDVFGPKSFIFLKKTKMMMPCLTRSVYQTNKLLPFPDLFVQPTMKNVTVKSHNIGKHIRILFETMLTAQDNNYQIGGSKAFF